MDVRNFIDLHVHIGPEPILRKFTVESITIAEKGKVAGMALKSHFFPTMPMINRAGQNGLLLVGSVVLNNTVGGMNPEAIRASAQLSALPIVVWFPTISAQNFLNQSTYEIPPEWGERKSRLSRTVRGITITERGKLAPEAKAVLQTIKENNCVLATGHISWREAKLLVEEAVRMEIRRIIVTHPIYQRIAMPLEVQQELARMKGVYIEQCYSMYAIDNIPVEEIAKQIKVVGAGKCILTSDMGQVNSPSPSEALEVFTELLKKEGIYEQELETMGEINPRKLLGVT